MKRLLPLVALGAILMLSLAAVTLVLHRSPALEATDAMPCADLDGDGAVTMADLIYEVGYYFHDDSDGNPGLPPYAPGYSPQTDMTSNGQIRVNDILYVFTQFGSTTACQDKPIGPKGSPGPTPTPGPSLSEMSLAVKSPGAFCDVPANPTNCTVPDSGPFTLSVEVKTAPAGGYVGFQTQVSYGALVYKPAGGEVVWPDVSASNSSSQSMVVIHGAASGVTPPMPVSTYTGNIVDLQFNCPSPGAFKVALPLYQTGTNPLGTTFFADDFATRVLPDVADSLTIHCASETPEVLGSLGTIGHEATILGGSPIRWVCDPGNLTTATAIRFDYIWGESEVTGTGAVSITQKLPPNVLNSVVCVFDGNAGTPITINWLLIDPSGVVTDIPSGLVIPEASVTLQVESPPNSGTYVDVAVESDPDPPDPGPYGIKEPDFNPEITGIDGRYAWDVAPGRYRVVVSKSTCTTTTSAPVVIPPPVTDLNVGITCQDNNSNNIPDVLESLYGINNPAGDDDGDGLMNQEELNLGTDPLVRDDVDNDGDGCVNLKKVFGPPGPPVSYRGELTSSQLSGGLRDDANPWDYFDPDKGPQSLGIQRIGDILVVLYKYYVDFGESGYDTSTDRAADVIGPDDWNLGPPDGLERIQDILHALDQYYNDCA